MLDCVSEIREDWFSKYLPGFATRAKALPVGVQLKLPSDFRPDVRPVRAHSDAV